jgi:hypothetical protein
MEGEKKKESHSGAVCKVGNHKNEGTCADGWLLSEKEGLTKTKKNLRLDFTLFGLIQFSFL